uniref:Uncharacterized protein n=1 Tax=Romanomermis culicivorax TaxID=13658 RepID=A0A915IX74_ROMCU
MKFAQIVSKFLDVFLQLRTKFYLIFHDRITIRYRFSCLPPNQDMQLALIGSGKNFTSSTDGKLLW